MKSFLILLFATVALATEADYYWRDYDGHIPDDAVLASNHTMEPVYVGQGYFPDVGILPGALRAGSTRLQVTERNNLPVITKNIKILCSKSTHGSLRWVPVSYPDISCLKKLDAISIVKGGTETSTEVYIGRHLLDETMTVGKVCNVAPYQGLNVPNNKGGSTSFQSFDLLVFM